MSTRATSTVSIAPSATAWPSACIVRLPCILSPRPRLVPGVDLHASHGGFGWQARSSAAS